MKILYLVLVLLLFCIFVFTQYSFAITDDIIKEKLKIDDTSTRPTFGLSHNNNKKIVDNGFSFNNQTFAITNNFHTPFVLHQINVGERNFFEAKVFAEQGLKVQEFIFGIPDAGEANLGETDLEVWYDPNEEIQKVDLVQKSKVIDEDSIVVSHEKSNCYDRNPTKICDSTKVSMIFLEPLKNKVMAIKAIDNLNRYQITYLNEGFEVTGKSLNPMPSISIPSNVRDEGLINVTQTKKYSPYWVSQDGRIFERNEAGSFKQINMEFTRFQDSGEPKTRLHSGFGQLIVNEQKKAVDIFDSSKIINELPSSKTYTFSNVKDRITKQLKEKMVEEEQKGLQYLKELKKPARSF